MGVGSHTVAQPQQTDRKRCILPALCQQLCGPLCTQNHLSEPETNPKLVALLFQVKITLLIHLQELFT